MINGISGKPGGGKSYEAVLNHIIPALKDGRRVVTNLPLQIDHFVAVYGESVRDLIILVEYDFHDYGNQKPFSRIEDWLQHQDWKNDKGQGVLFVVDEAHLSLPSRMQKNSGIDITKVLEFLSMHRHYGFDILLITQNFKKVHADIRDMVQLVYRCIKKSMFGQDDAYIIKVHEGCTSQVVNTDEREYQSFVFKFYKSHTKSESQIVEATTRDVKPWYKTGLMKLSYFVLFVAILLIINVARMVFSDDEKHVVKDAPVKKEIVTHNTNKPDPNVNNFHQNNSQIIHEKPVPSEDLLLEETIQKKDLPSLSQQTLEYQKMIKDSENYHPFHQVTLTISGYAEDLNFKLFYFSAQQNGQHIFSMTSKDLLLAGYSVQVISSCLISLRYFKYQKYITCTKQNVGVVPYVESTNTDLIEQ